MERNLKYAWGPYENLAKVKADVAAILHFFSRSIPQIEATSWTRPGSPWGDAQRGFSERFEPLLLGKGHHAAPASEYGICARFRSEEGELTCALQENDSSTQDECWIKHKIK